MDSRDIRAFSQNQSDDAVSEKDPVVLLGKFTHPEMNGSCGVVDLVILKGNGGIFVEVDQEWTNL